MKKFAFSMDFEINLSEKDFINQDYIKYFNLYNILPILIPNSIDNPTIYNNFFNFDGIILTGGIDINPILSELKPNSRKANCSNRDKIEWILLEIAIEQKIPLLGICRGMQFINVFFGGKVINQIKLNLPNIIQHVRNFHTLKLIDDDFIELFGYNKIRVNSYHNNGITRECLAPKLKAFAVCGDDDIIEGIYHPNCPIIGLQWHPERENPSKDFNYELLDGFFNKGKFWGEK